MSTKTEKEVNKSNEKSTKKEHLTTFLTLFIALLVLFLIQKKSENPQDQVLKEKKCFETCRFRIVESIPINITFGDVVLPMSTFDAWKTLIKGAQKELVIAAYKSSLQGKHVLGNLDRLYSQEVWKREAQGFQFIFQDINAFQGDQIYQYIMEVGKSKSVNVKIVENYPPKDNGDNADGVILQNFGAVHRKSIDISDYMGRGKMHSKFLIADRKSFYLGSANLDWRSLNQKMELGVFVEDCECLGEDLHNIFNVLWNLKENGIQNNRALQQKASYNMKRPLKVQIQGAPAQVYIATSPKELNHPERTWDLDAIVHEIDSAKQFLDIHVMDYFPLFIYRKPRKHFAQIDDAIRRAIVRGVRIRLLAAALHYPDITTRFLRSLETLNQVNENGTVQVKIFKVPNTKIDSVVINRERRTHNKFMVTESAAVIGTSNWSGDYFIGGTTGAAIVIQQNEKHRPFIDEMKDIFTRDWESQYSHPLNTYYQQCVETNNGGFCEGEKDPTLFASNQAIKK